MKLNLKLALFFGVSLFLLMIFASFLLPSKGEVMDSVLIYAPDSLVQSKLKSFESYPHWFPWVNSSSELKEIESEGSEKKGFVFIGEGDAGEHSGVYKIKRMEGDSIIHFAIDFRDMPHFYGVFLISGNQEKTLVAWKLNMVAGWKPWWRFYAAMMNKTAKPALTEGLNRLKEVCEGRP